MDRELRILILDDREADVELSLRELRKSELRFIHRHADNRESFLKELQGFSPDLVLMDFSLPGFDAMAALRMVQEVAPHVPCIVVSGTIGEDVAIETLKKGATDYILKGRMARLVPSVRRALVEAEKQAELDKAVERIREQAMLLDKAQDAIMVLDLADRITYWNKSAERLYGWAAGEVEGKNASQLLGVQPSPGAIDPGRPEPGSGEWIGELKQVARDGRELIVESRQTLIRDRDGEPVSNLVVNTDITARKKLESQFLRAQRLESIGMLAGGIAHDLNNILTPILMAADVIKSKLPDSESLSVLSSLQSSAMRGADMVKQILMFARGAGGERAQFQLKHILRDLDKIIRETFPKSIELSMDVPNDLWTVSGDATQMQQVLLNLCVNARDAMPSGGNLRISAQNHMLDETEPGRKSEETPLPHILVEIADTGTGMSAEIGAKIFEPFFTTKGVGKGTGLGLSTALSIVKSHGGFIQVDSAVKRGTTFRVFLPAIPASQPADDKVSGAELPVGHGELLLVVEDDTSIREMTRETLESFGYRVLTAANGGQAIAVFAKHSDAIRLVLMDMIMPIMQGPESIEAIRKLKSGTRIVLITGLSIEQMPAESTGTDFVLRKPYTLAALLNTIHDALKR